MTHINLLYLGGTFGCYGNPLTPLPSDQFFLRLQAIFPHQNDHPAKLQSLPHLPVKDSSQLTPSDLVQILRAIWCSVSLGERRFLLITGTDTLAYLAAFLQVALAKLPISLAVTASMSPLFAVQAQPPSIDPCSDAYANLLCAIGWLDEAVFGVAVCIQGDLLDASSLQKMHSQAPNAFVALPFTPALSTSQPILMPAQPNFELMDYYLVKYGDIHTIYLTPNEPDKLADELYASLKLPPSALIIVAFGAGNMPYSPAIAQAIKSLHEHHTLVIIASSCPFGSRSLAYQAGSWQYESGALFSADMTLPAIYAQALWLCLSMPPKERHEAWRSMLARRTPTE